MKTLILMSLLIVGLLSDSSCQNKDSQQTQTQTQTQKQIAEQNFKTIDKNGDMKISIDEMSEYLESDNPVAFYKMDLDKDNMVSMDEFTKQFEKMNDELLRMRQDKQDTQEYKYMKGQVMETVQRYWHVIDTNQDGIIDRDELFKYFQKMGQSYHSDQQFKVIDTNQDQQISFKEFKVWLIDNARLQSSMEYTKQKMKDEL